MHRTHLKDVYEGYPEIHQFVHSDYDDARVYELVQKELPYETSLFGDYTSAWKLFKHCDKLISANHPL